MASLTISVKNWMEVLTVIDGDILWDKREHFSSYEITSEIHDSCGTKYIFSPFNRTFPTIKYVNFIIFDC